jgi:DNA-binding NarL/FixJ family response regulator
MIPTRPITVLLVDDHTVVRRALAALLRAAQFKVVGEARTGREAVKKAWALRPTVTLMDIAMPVLNGIEATRQILAAIPGARVIILSAHSEDVYVECMVRAGAAGFLDKKTSATQLTQAIREVAAGRKYFSPAISLPPPVHPRPPVEATGRRNGLARRLTARESAVLHLLAGGLVDEQVASELGVGVKAVELHRRKIVDKLHVPAAVNLARFALGAGLVAGQVQLKIT